MLMPPQTASRVILGTAQLGLRYGLANQSGQPDLAAAVQIVQSAWEGGIRLFDTAQVYGTSEIALGEALRKLNIGEKAQIISKLDPSLRADDTFCLRDIVGSSLGRLGVPALYALLLHREEQLAWLDGAPGEALRRLVADGLVRYVGVSVYNPEAARRALSHPLVSVLQSPAGLFDRRFEAARIFSLARELGKEMHIRSVLLQGALCLEPEALPAPLARLAPALADFRAICASRALPPAPLALAWALGRHPESLVLFGAETPKQVEQNFNMLDEAASLLATLAIPLESVMPPQDDELLNPSLWSL